MEPAVTVPETLGYVLLALAYLALGVKVGRSASRMSPQSESTFVGVTACLLWPLYLLLYLLFTGLRWTFPPRRW